MSYTTIHTKKNGARYLYKVEGYWDKEKKAPRNRQVCLGRIDDETGEVISSGMKARAAKCAEATSEVTARSTVIGPSLLLDKVASDTGLVTAIKKSLPSQYLRILSAAYFLVQKGLPLSRCEAWSRANKHPYGEAMGSQSVSELLREFGESERQMFFKVWMKHLASKENMFYDITSISSYSELNEYVRWGHNRDNEKMPQINLAMLFGQDSGLPTYYRRLQGSISDVSTLKTTVASLDKIGQGKLVFVMDRGFYSETKGKNTVVTMIPWKKYRAFAMSLLKLFEMKDTDPYELIERLNWKIVGWSNFYRYTDHTAMTYQRIDNVIFWKLAHWLAGKYGAHITDMMRNHCKYPSPEDARTWSWKSTRGKMIYLERLTGSKKARRARPIMKINPYMLNPEELRETKLLVSSFKEIASVVNDS
jgi:hypothetical protein